MRHRTLILLGLSAMIAATIAEARTGDRLRARLAEQRAEAAQPAALPSAKPAEVLRYGTATDQRILFYPAPAPAANARRRAPPLAVFIHGGGWSKGEPEMVAQKPAWYASHGWAFASIGYRLLPEAPVEDQARDIGAALIKLRAEAARLGFDPDRILLTGHSAGAHLAALVSTDPAYAGSAFAAIKGTIPIDGACYDVVTQMQQGGAFMRKRTYLPVFGSDPARQRALSPTTHAGGRDVGDWLLLYTSARDDAQQQSEALAATLRRSGARTEVFAVPAKSQQKLSAHREINVEFGTPGYAANAQVVAIMRRVAG
jgi:arylformamidase